MTQEFVTLPREVVGQALEAFAVLLTYNTSSTEYAAGRSARDALRAALDNTQVELDPVAYEYVEHRPYGAPGEIRRGTILLEHYRNADGIIAGDWEWLVKQFMVSKNTISMRPLYTHPQPKREPLTEDEIDKLCPQYDDPMRREMWIIGFKAVHGIK